ncbi:helix-turn-helix domain-containing protein [Pseudonocardia ailaonensis]|uniref:Helix-turn-helix domain-containing protein n=1 Tax=Pseudonocardia ailaonensis TaxID=367279 RepID=A0ABN2MUE6_9PSEU
MGQRLPEPSVESIELTAVLSALADPNRRALMGELYRSGEPRDCGALDRCVVTGLSAPTLSHHWKVLRESGLTRTVAEGRSRIISVRREDMEARFPGLLGAVLGAPVDNSAG